jgi:hypothetical protein
MSERRLITAAKEAAQMAKGNSMAPLTTEQMRAYRDHPKTPPLNKELCALALEALDKREGATTVCKVCRNTFPNTGVWDYQDKNVAEINAKNGMTYLSTLIPITITETEGH